MSAADEEDEVMLCASCGVAGSDGIKLRNCTACYLVRYCSVKCQKEHRPKHKKECKKRAAELKDEILFKQPDSSHYGDCPICCLPLPLAPRRSTLMTCCSKQICDGCNFANVKRELEGRLQHKCPFCRKDLPKTTEEGIKQVMNRSEANDPVALYEMGATRYVEGDFESVSEYWKRAASLGNVSAHHQLSFLYHIGKGVEKDEKKALHHLEQAAIGGQPDARHNLGLTELENGQYKRAVKHWIIAAKLGHDESLEHLKEINKSGHLSNEDLAAALRGHKAAIEETKSPEREKGAAYTEWLAEHGRGVRVRGSSPSIG